VASLSSGKVNISAGIAEELTYYSDLPVVVSLSPGKVNNEYKKYKLGLTVVLFGYVTIVVLV